MINLENNYSILEQNILKKLFVYSKENGIIAEISGWAVELGISKQEVVSIAINMKSKKWLELCEQGLDNTISVSLSFEGFRVIGEKPINYSEDVKDLLILKDDSQYIIKAIFYNNNESDFSFSHLDFDELKLIVKDQQISNQVLVSDWLKKHNVKLRNILNSQKKSYTKNLFDFIELIKSYD